MRIGLIAPPWVPIPPKKYGGTESVIDRLARGFVAAGHEVLLFATGDSTCPVPTEWVLAEAEGLNMGNAVLEMRHLLHAYDAVRDCDVVHDHTVLGPVYAQRFPNLPVVTTNHGPFNDELRDIYRAISPRVPIIAISRDQAATAGDIPIARVIHHGLTPGEFPVGDGGDYLVHLGRMAPEKGVHRAARVARAAGVPLVIAAKMREPWEKEYFEAEVKPLLGPNVEYIGEVGGREKVDLLGGALGLVNPIRWHEPFGLVMIEALACGTPVLAFPEGAAPEIIDHGVTGFLGVDEMEMVEQVDLLGGIDRHACRSVVENYFSTTRMVQDHVDLFEILLADRAPLGTPSITLP